VHLYRAALAVLPSPPTRDEVIALLDVFPLDDATMFGLAWTLLHYVEAAPDWPYVESLDDRSWWLSFLRERADRGAL
jgi:hypothetical protein